MIRLLPLLLVFLVGCGNNIESEPVPTSEAHQNFATTVENDLKTSVVIKQVENTLWIYVPFEENLIELKSTKDGPMKVKEVSSKPAINFLEANFENNNFVIEYDIGTVRSYPKSFGYSSSYSQKFQALQQGLYMSLLNTFNDVYDDESYQAPEFVYIIIADMKTGIEVNSLIYMDDLRHMMHAQEEFQKRVISEVQGHEKIVGDRTGEHLDLTPITFPEFLAKQMAHRINFKYTRSTFPPSEDALKEIQMQVKTTLELYNFKDFDNIIINNLENELSTEVTTSDLENIEMEGRLITIDFSQESGQNP